MTGSKLEKLFELAEYDTGSIRACVVVVLTASYLSSQDLRQQECRVR